MEHTDTIAAFCTAPGGALAIIRISGPDALRLADTVWHSSRKLSAEHPRVLTFGRVRQEDGSNQGETCLAVYMPGPASYTGEDIVEIQCHGGACAPRRILSRLLANGARLAEPGEFTKRAFLNGKMDLTEAEAVADLISAKSEAAFRLAERQLSGSLGQKIRSAKEEIFLILAEIESRLDFPEEDLDWQSPAQIVDRINQVKATLEQLLAGRDRSAVIRNGVRLAIAGSPNVGKSSLLNLLLGYERAIVTDIPGTTRDTLSEQAVLRGISVELTDTAGIRDQVADAVEGFGVERSRDTIKLSEIVLWVFDSSRDPLDDLQAMKNEIPAGAKVIAVWNKSDLAPEGFVIPETECPSVAVSVKNETGIDTLLSAFETAVWGGGDKSIPECAVSERHAGALERAISLLEMSIPETEAEMYELTAENLRAARQELAEITGESAAPDVLDDIFSRFCIGK
ncbi:MAG: tRNA uridine-5-carboxymethylaminomethyl(34) synthesis GTPase MnmE [Lentisphaerae bacterium]|nr:tRNA uridine-5-carboxymethylaminomethyl(34) synthesis GTPase MnmE [Lentisphaerota bacterium]